MARVVDQADRIISLWGEALARRINRREMMFKAVRGVGAAAAAASVGSLASIKDVFASCDCGYLGFCSSYGATCPTRGCPSSCTACTSANGCGCPHSSGYWVIAGCSCGVCGNGWYECWDCKCPSCSQLCTCKSTCVCSGCCSPGDVAREFSVLHPAA